MKTLNISLSDSSPYICIEKDNYVQSKNFICNSYIAFHETMHSWLYISLFKYAISISYFMYPEDIKFNLQVDRLKFKYSIINIFRSLFKLKPIIKLPNNYVIQDLNNSTDLDNIQWNKYLVSLGVK